MILPALLFERAYGQLVNQTIDLTNTLLTQQWELANTIKLTDKQLAQYIKQHNGIITSPVPPRTYFLDWLRNLGRLGRTATTSQNVEAQTTRKSCYFKLAN